jgi:hypothetical protein
VPAISISRYLPGRRIEGINDSAAFGATDRAAAVTSTPAGITTQFRKPMPAVAADLLQVTTVPTVIAFSPDGSELGRMVGVPRRSDLKQAVAELERRARDQEGALG